MKKLRLSLHMLHYEVMIRNVEWYQFILLKMKNPFELVD